MPVFMVLFLPRLCTISNTQAVLFASYLPDYQIEHHMWPNLSMLSYQKSAPLVQEICSRHGVPYIKQSVFIRLKKTVDIMVGNTNMKWFPEPYENMFLERDALAEAVAAAKNNAQ